MRLTVLPLACLCLLSAVASAADDPAALDLSLPATQPPFRNDPPGTWYGDTSGVPADPAPATATAAAAVALRRPACPTAADGSERTLTGSVATGVGYSSGLGSSTYNAANLNYCKSLVDDDGDTSTINVQMHVDRYDGPDVYRGPGPGTLPRGGRFGR